MNAESKSCFVFHKIICSFLVLLILTACDRGAKNIEGQKVKKTIVRVDPLFEKTKVVCFGRFLVEVPDTAVVAWGATDIPLGVSIYQNGAIEVDELAKQFISKLSSQKAINHNDEPLLIEVKSIEKPSGKIVVGYEDFESINGLVVNGYFSLNGGGVVIESRPLKRMKEKIVNDINNIAQRIRSRTEDEVPEEAGNCLEYAFLPDNANSENGSFSEHVSIGFRLKEFPDAHLSIYVAPSNVHNPEQDSLEEQMRNVKYDFNSVEEKTVLVNTKFFREGKREIHEWNTGYEVLMRSPDENTSLSHHDFHLRFNGVPRDRLKPYADIRFETGVANNAAGATKASLTDEEAIAIWDKITSSIRVRPTTDKAVKTGDASHEKRRPLGELAVTGRTCPQTGWWEASEEDDIAGDRRRHLQAGELMPHAMSRGDPSLWQKLRGEQPVHRAATVWKLVSYDDGLSRTKAKEASPAITHRTTKGPLPDDTGDDNARPGQQG